MTEPEGPPKPKRLAEREEMVCDGREERNPADLMFFTNMDTFDGLSLNDLDEELNNDNSSTTQSEETDSTGELVLDGTRDSTEAEADVGESSFQRHYADKSLPDLIKSGRPLCRRRTVGHVSETLKEVRREVELSRRRSIRLKAQVDKLQESRDGLGWSQHRENVTEEVLSVVKLLYPLVDPESSIPPPGHGENRLDAALAQLQNVARKLAISHTSQDSQESGKNGQEDSAILQQALRDRDEAIEKKAAMEDEVLRSKTEMMMLNNQLLEAAQKRLEISLELEAWKEDFQQLLQQQLLIQQQAEQAQKKPSRMGILRRNNKPVIQRPSNFPLPAPVPPTTNFNQIFTTGHANLQSPSDSFSPPNSSKGTWKLKFKKGKNSQILDLDGEEQDSEYSNDGFQVVSLH